MKVLFRSCGGLGNQIFQLFFTRLLANKYNIKNIVHYHESNYERVAHWEYPSKQLFLAPKLIEYLILKLRLPKILFKLGIIEHEYIKLYKYYIVDGYFQNQKDYVIFPRISISKNLILLKKDLILLKSQKQENKILYHFRLGDFFNSNVEEIIFIEKTLLNIEPNSNLISNKDDYFINYNLFFDIIKEKKINLIKTSKMNSIELFNLFLNHQLIVSNGSSLAFSAAILGDIEIQPFEGIDYSNYQKASFERLLNLKRYLCL